MFISPFQGYLNGRFHILNVIVFRDQPRSAMVVLSILCVVALSGCPDDDGDSGSGNTSNGSLTITGTYDYLSSYDSYYAYGNYTYVEGSITESDTWVAVCTYPDDGVVNEDLAGTAWKMDETCEFGFHVNGINCAFIDTSDMDEVIEGTYTQSGHSFTLNFTW
jgi:hypothetical protein